MEEKREETSNEVSNISWKVSYVFSIVYNYNYWSTNAILIKLLLRVDFPYNYSVPYLLIYQSFPSSLSVLKIISKWDCTNYASVFAHTFITVQSYNLSKIKTTK